MKKDRERIRRVMIAINKIDRIYEQISLKLGRKANVTFLLYALDDGKPHSQKQLCAEWLFPKTTLNTIVKELEREGLVTLEAVPGQRRERYVRLTEAGKTCAREVLDWLYQAEQEAFERLGAADALIQGLESFCEGLAETVTDVSLGKDE